MEVFLHFTPFALFRHTVVPSYWMPLVHNMPEDVVLCVTLRYASFVSDE